ncbi:MAG TPA: EAL domain-containing protein, partial [Rhodocyclaceae bacterium]|nr:EAL domain-containing protein [Rhodocyclaceae bacterium]
MPPSSMRLADTVLTATPRSQPYALLTALVLLLLSVPWWSQPLLHLLEHPYLFPVSAHTVMECFAILVSFLVFAISWNTYSPERPGNIVIIACGFLCVGLLDFAHMLSYKGMPDFVTPASPQKAIAFWLFARYVDVMILLLVALRGWQPFASTYTRYHLLLVGVLGVAALYWLTLYRPELLPRFFVEGSGLTPLKIALEYALILILVLTALLFRRRGARNPDLDVGCLLTATLVTILSEICLSSYTSVNDAYSLLGHCYKVIAYWFIYRAIFVSSVQLPYARLQAEMQERQRAEETAAYLSQHDTLTGLPNRSLLEARLEHSLAEAQRNRQLCAVAFVNLDNFKSVNDSLGLACGDELLKIMATRLTQCIKRTDTLARYGGDEFVLVLADLQNDADIMPVLQKILDTVQDACVVGGQEVAMTVSIGLARYPVDGDSPAQLLKHADAAMHRAKQIGGNTYSFFEEAMNAAATEYIALRNGIKRGIARGEFLLHYQPQLDLVDGSVRGIEALVRWQHPQSGLIPPAQFIPVAEESGLILPLSNWILETACRQAVTWQHMGLPPMRVAVNLSALQFRRDALVQRVRDTLAATGLQPHFLELELTESLLMQDQDGVSAAIRELKALGVRIAIDDFGTGYSSLAYLKRFAVDVLKIDQSFTRGIVDNAEDLAIVNAIIQMAHSLGLGTLAEGVETEAARELLERYGCNEGQGYLFARPLPAAEVPEFLRRRRGPA